jgi:hypothetical protein
VAFGHELFCCFSRIIFHQRLFLGIIFRLTCFISPTLARQENILPIGNRLLSLRGIDTWNEESSHEINANDNRD